MVRRTKEQAAETGRNVLLAAERLFLDKGYDNVSLEEVATLAGVTRGAVHWHFKNKQGLILALRDEGQEPFRKLADDLTSSVGAASLEKLDKLISEMFARLEHDARQRGLFRVMLRLDIALADQSQDSGSSFHDEMANIILRILRAIERDSGLSPPWTPEKAASMLTATMLGLIVEWSLGQRNHRLSPDRANLIKMMLSSWER
ncbi:TetR/AcrR family transcriptional regulator [Rhizobium puerariae]|uniref:TetR/AcrR family transcriptional regulator n=1 Tax=Rhizobium puerariae TaxID=1585791 RepID=A0ABV6ADL4_9HYPH